MRYASQTSPKPICPHCGGKRISLAAVQIGIARCDDCGYSQSRATVNYSGDASNLIGGLVALGIVAVGAVVIGALLESLGNNQQRKVTLPRYDEYNWQAALK